MSPATERAGAGWGFPDTRPKTAARPRKRGVYCMVTRVVLIQEVEKVGVGTTVVLEKTLFGLRERALVRK